MEKKSKKLIWIISRLMTLIMAVTLLSGIPMQNVLANDSKETDRKKYEIYPIPQSIKYEDKSVNLTEDANIVFEEGIDEATKNRLIEVLSTKEINYELSTEIKEDKLNFLIGLNNSNGIVDNYFTENNLVNDTHFENNDAHIISAKDNVVAVLGKDTDSAFYGITSLKLIFNQLENNELNELLIEDYSDGQWRGFIEGYYGIPWSNENRMELMKFGGDFKMNSYIFAPKDDEYHSLKWREPYPAEKLAEIEEMVQVGASTKTKFIWTIHPFLKDGMNFETEESYATDLEKIITKFEQLYSVGVRQFGVLADDAEGDANNQVKLMNDLEKWRLQKGDVYEFIFVPKVYTKESAGGNINNEYLNIIGTMPQTVDIMWTGDVVLGYVTQDTFEFFEKAVGRQAFMWLNWPVNDINNKRLLMGKGEMLDPTVRNFKGIVTNPMQEAQASKVALFAIADYGWNRAAFDMDKSWEDSFKYVEPDATEELYTFAKHMSDPSPNWHGLSLEESEELRPTLEKFIRKLWDKESIIQFSEEVLNEYEVILEATNSFAKKSKNELLKSEIKGWVDSLRDLTESTIAYVKASVAFEKGNYEEAIRYYVLGEDEFTASRSHRTPTLNGVSRPEPGTKYLIPFAKDLSKIIGDNIDQIINPDATKITLRPYTNMDPLYWGHVQNIADGDNTRYSSMWIRRSAKTDDYVAVELNKATKIENILFEQGQDEGDTFNYCKFQYSMDGETWTDVNGIDYGPNMKEIVIENLDITAKHLRVVPTREILGNWIAVREFSVNKKEKINDDGIFEVNPEAEPKFEAKNLIDRKLNTAFKPLLSAPKVGYLTYKISDKTDIKNFTIVQNSNTISNAIVSVRGEDGWSDIGKLEKSFNYFDTKGFKNIFEIKIVWDGIAPTIHEIGISTLKEETTGITPNKIKDLQSKNITSNSIELAWKIPENTTIKEYIIYKDGIELARTTKPEFTVEDLKANTLYGFKIVAISKDNLKSRPVSKNFRTLKN